MKNRKAKTLTTADLEEIDGGHHHHCHGGGWGGPTVINQTYNSATPNSFTQSQVQQVGGGYFASPPAWSMHSTQY